MVIACSSYKTYQIRRAVWNSTLFCFLFLFTIPSEPVEANLFKVDNMLNGVDVYISCFKTRSARNFFCVWMVSSSGWNSTLFCFLFLFTIPSDSVEADLFKVDNMLNGVMFTSAVSELEVHEISFAFRWFPPALRSLVEWKQMKTKKPTLLGGGCVEICLNKVMSPSPGELLFDASAQSPPSDKTVEMLHFS